MRNALADLDALREQLEEEADSKTDLQRQLARANAEANQWRVKFESEGVSRAEELEEIRRKLTNKLQEYENNFESANSKIINLEKTKTRLQVRYYLYVCLSVCLSYLTCTNNAQYTILLIFLTKTLF